jgi:hypothetical protein
MMNGYQKIYLTYIMQYLQTVNFALWGKQNIISAHAQFSALNNTAPAKCHSFKKQTVFLISRVKWTYSLKLYWEYWAKIQWLLHDFIAKIHNMYRLKACNAFLVNPLLTNVIGNSLPIPTMLLTSWKSRRIRVYRWCINPSLQSNSESQCQERSICNLKSHSLYLKYWHNRLLWITVLQNEFSLSCNIMQYW